MAGDEFPGQPVPPSWSRALWRLWFLRSVDAVPRGSPAGAIVLLSAVWLAAWTAIDWWQRQPEPRFFADGIALLGWYAMGIAGLAGVLRYCARPRPGFGGALALALGFTPVPLLLASVGWYVLGERSFQWMVAAAALYGLLYLSRGLRTLTGRPQRAASLAGLLCVAAFVYESNALNAIPDVWNPSDASASAGEDVLAAEEAAAFEQSDRIDEALEGVQRDRNPAPEAFFLGFAGVGEQRVFAQEIGLAARVIGERFDVGDRGLSLVNDERDFDSAPIASVSGLTYALKGLADRMNLDQDVLFLAISSHGDKDAVVAVANAQLPLQSLTGEDLAAALEDSGIQWRVIIISACYAGGFIDSLRNPKTIVITAAAADRTSFGCSNDSDLTYFGEAFYRDALPGAASLRAAFTAAKAAIAARERDGHETPSNPQAYFGPEMEAKLNDLVRGAPAVSAGLAGRRRGAS